MNPYLSARLGSYFIRCVGIHNNYKLTTTAREKFNQGVSSNLKTSTPSSRLVYSIDSSLYFCNSGLLVTLNLGPLQRMLLIWGCFSVGNQFSNHFGKRASDRFVDQRCWYPAANVGVNHVDQLTPCTVRSRNAFQASRKVEA